MDESALDIACKRWVKRVYRRDGTVPTRGEWMAWRAAWNKRHRHLGDSDDWHPSSDCRCLRCKNYFHPPQSDTD